LPEVMPKEELVNRWKMLFPRIFHM
jgi:hypothetical protein